MTTYKKISASEERALKILAASDFAASPSEFIVFSFGFDDPRQMTIIQRGTEK